MTVVVLQTTAFTMIAVTLSMLHNPVVLVGTLCQANHCVYADSLEDGR